MLVNIIIIETIKFGNASGISSLSHVHKIVTMVAQPNAYRGANITP